MLPTPAAAKTHNCILRIGAPGATSDIGLMLPDGNLKLFQMQSYSPFAPAARQGEAANRDFAYTAVWEIHNDFSGGSGHIYEQPVESGDYEFAQGLDASGAATLGSTLFSAKRKVLLSAAAETTAGAIGTFKQFIQFSGAWYAVTNATPGVIYKWDATGVTPSVVETLTTTCTQLYMDGTTLYAAQGASNVARTTTDGATWANAAYNANAHCVRDEGVLTYIYGATLVAGTGYADAISVGWSTTTANNMVYFLNSLWIGKPEGLYRFQYGRVSCVFPVFDQYNSTNFVHMTVHHGLLYFNVQNHLFYTNGEGSFVNIFPDDTNGFDAINCLFATFGPLLIAAKMRNMAGSAREYLFLFDGPDHPGLNPIWSDADGSLPVYGCGSTNVYDTTKVRVYLSQKTTGEKWVDLKTTYEPSSFHTKSAATSYINLTEFSGGFRVLKKWFYEVVLNVRSPISTTYAKVWYSIDGGTWTQTLDKDGAVQTLTLSARSVGTYFPLNSTGTYVQIRVEVWTTTSASSAEVSHVTVRGETRVTPRYQFAFPVDCSKTVAPLQGEADSGEAIRTQLLTASNQGYPCKLCDPWGNWHLVSFRPPSPLFSVTGYETPTGNAPERLFTIASLVLMEVDPLGTDGALAAWTPG